MSRRAKSLRIAGGFTVAVLCGLGIGGAVLTEGSLRVPRRVAAGGGPPGGAPVQIAAADGAILRGSFFGTPGPVGCVMVLHGISDSRSGAAGFVSMFLQSGFAVLAPDARGHGESGGDLLTYGVLERDDARRWAGWLRRDRGCRKVFGLGESLGAASLIMAASGADGGGLDAVVAECSYSDLPSVAAYRVGLLVGDPQVIRTVVAHPLVWSATVYARLRYGLDLRRAAPVEAVHELGIPLLLIHGLADTRTPPDHSRRILAAAKPGTARLWEVPGAEHTAASSVAGDRFRAEVLEHFGLHLFRGPPGH